jgi:uncharacterized protein with LGFP repeats
MSVIDDRYAALGEANSFLGAVVSDEQPTGDGKARYRIYEHGAIYWLVYDPSGGGLSTKTFECTARSGRSIRRSGERTSMGCR